LAAKRPSAEGLRLLAASDLLERFLWVGSRPDVEAALDSIDRSDVGRVAAAAAPPLPLEPFLRPPRVEEGGAEELEARGLSRVISRAFEFVDRVSDDPDVVFRAVFQNLYGFARENLTSEHSWFDNSNVTGSRQSEARHLAYRWIVEDEASGNIAARFLARSLVFDCEKVYSGLRRLDVAWRRSGRTKQAVWAEGASGARDIRFFASADGTAELAVRGGSVSDALQTVETFAAALDAESMPIESMDSVLASILSRTS
jgi:hypothetical protein